MFKKEALDRIKEAYYSGLKVQIWFNGHWKNFDVRDYPINTDPFSEHRMYRIVGSAYVDIAEKQIADLKKENAELKAQLQKKINITTVSDYPYSVLKLEEAKEIIRQLLLLPYANNEEVYSDVTSVLDKAEHFLKEE